MASFTLSQAKASVDPLGHRVYYPDRGKNTLSASISGSDLANAWVELSLDGGAFEPMRVFDENALSEPIGASPDGTAITGISIREGFGMEWVSGSQDTLYVVYGQEGTTRETMMRAESPNGDPTSFENPTQVHTDPTGGTRIESPCLFYDRDGDQLRTYYESEMNPYLVGIDDADTRAGQSWAQGELIGGSNWSHGVEFASPEVWIYDGQYYISGEEHTSGNMNLMIARGDAPDSFNEYKYAASPSDFSFTEHTALKGPWFGPDGGIYGYVNPVWSDGNYRPAPFWSTELDADGYPTNWTAGTRHETHMIGFTLTLFNDRYVYGFPDSGRDRIVYWHLDGTTDDRTLNSGGGDVSWTFYQPTTPPGSTVEWQVAVEDGSGNVERSSPQSFVVQEGGVKPGIMDDSFAVL